MKNTKLVYVLMSKNDMLRDVNVEGVFETSELAIQAQEILKSRKSRGWDFVILPTSYYE